MITRYLPYLISGFALIASLSSSAQNDIDAKLKKLFFELDLNQSIDSIKKQLQYNTAYPFQEVADTIGCKIIPSFYPYFKLVNSHQSPVDCDSTFIFVQPVIGLHTTGHEQGRSETIYSTQSDVSMYFSDSLKAYQAQQTLAKYVVDYFGLESSSGEMEINGKIGGYFTKIELDKKNNGVEFRRELDISVRNYKGFYTVNLIFSRYTFKKDD